MTYEILQEIKESFKKKKFLIIKHGKYIIRL